MAGKFSLRVSILCLTLLNVACGVAYSVTSTKIKDILDHPRDYENKEVSIYGTVTNTVSLLVIKYYEIQDETGSIKIVTDRLLPSRGEKLRVNGRTTVIEIGTERWVVLRENKETANWGMDTGNTGGSPQPDY
jgi:hypothetical protein